MGLIHLAAEITPPVPAVAPSWVYVVLAFLSLLGIVIPSWIAVSARDHARQANEAVNQRHLKGVHAETGEPIHPRLYDAVIDALAVTARTEGKVDHVITRVSVVEKRLGDADQQLLDHDTKISDLITSGSDHTDVESSASLSKEHSA